MKLDALEQGTILLKDSVLDAPIKIVSDKYGLNHILAESELDVFFGQGFNVARERLWQIDLWRRRGLGLLAEVLGPGFFAQDRVSRLFLYSSCMNREWSSYSDGTQAICESFCRGINAYVDLIRMGHVDLPVEFKILDFRPSKWSAEDIVRIRSNTLTTNAVSELKRAELLQGGHVAADRLRGILRPGRPDIAVSSRIEGIETLIAMMELATAPVVITRERLDARIADVEQWVDPRTFVFGPNSARCQTTRETPVEGSNNWAIAGARTESGFPILANDPHRALQTPSLRYAVHLHCPAFSAIGAGEPSLPGISIGHNGSVAFGLTIFPADQEDVFLFDIPRSPLSGQLQVRKDTICIRGEDSVEVELHRFCGSPVLRLDHAAGTGIAVRTVWSEPGASPYLGSLALLRSESVKQFRELLATWRLPAVNYVVADRAGSIGWFVAGTVPRRKAGSGLVPQKSNEDPWLGFIPNVELPSSIDPCSGYVMSANEFNLPDGWDHIGRSVAYEWYEEFRARRIHEKLLDNPRATVSDSLELQDDAMSVAARDLLELVRDCLDFAELSGQSPIMEAFLKWNGTLDPEATEARFYCLWVGHFLKPAVLRNADPNTPDMYYREVSTEAMIAEIRNYVKEERRLILESSLLSAAQAFEDRTPPMRSAVFQHAIRDGVAPALKFSAEGRLWQGDDSAVHFGKSGSSIESIEFGASFRMVIDLSSWDNSRWSNVPDQTPLATNSWSPAPLLYSLRTIEANTVRSIRIMAN